MLHFWKSLVSTSERYAHGTFCVIPFKVCSRPGRLLSVENWELYLEFSQTHSSPSNDTQSAVQCRGLP